MTRCGWCGEDPLYLDYHDREWGVPLHDDTGLFEFLVLETFQAGLSWLTILRKRENFRRAFDGFDPDRVARFTPGDIERLLGDPGIVRNRAKIEAAVSNARAFRKIQESAGSFNRYIWSFQAGRPVVNHWRTEAEIPAFTPGAVAISKDMKQKGFRFTGPTVIYAHMQATGMVNDHRSDCFRHAEIQRLHS